MVCWSRAATTDGPSPVSRWRRSIVAAMGSLAAPAGNWSRPTLVMPASSAPTIVVTATAQTRANEAATSGRSKDLDRSTNCMTTGVAQSPQPLLRPAAAQVSVTGVAPTQPTTTPLSRRARSARAHPLSPSPYNVSYSPLFGKQEPRAWPQGPAVRATGLGICLSRRSLRFEPLGTGVLTHIGGVGR